MNVILNLKEAYYIYLFYTLHFLIIMILRRYKIYNIEFNYHDQQENFNKLTTDGVEFLRKPCIKYGTVGKAMVPPSLINAFEEQLKEMEVARDIAIDDVYE